MDGIYNLFYFASQRAQWYNNIIPVVALSI